MNMGNFLTRFYNGPAVNQVLDIKQYQKSLKRRGRVIFGLTSAIFFFAGLKLTGSVLLGLGISFIPAVILWKRQNDAWKEIQPEFVTEEWDSCVSSIQKTIQKLTKRHKEDYVFKYPIFINLPLLAIYHMHHRDLISQLLYLQEPDSEEDLNDALHFMRFASSAYGGVYMRFLKIIKELPMKGIDEVDLNAICAHTGVQEGDVIAMELTGVQVNCPAYFVAIDHSKKAVVVTIRGTSNIGDVMTDLVCKSVQFLDGVAHEGIKVGAEKLFVKTIKLVCSLLCNNPGYSLVVTGHSLGAGTSILLTMLYLDFQQNLGQSESHLMKDGLIESAVNMKLPKNVNIHCYAFAPPPVFDRAGQEMSEFHDIIDVYVNHCDIVPRLSLAAFNDFLHALQQIDSLNLDLKDRLGVFFFAIHHPLVKTIIETVKSVLEDINFSASLAENDSHFARLSIPGRIHLMQKKSQGKKYSVSRKKSNFFSHMLLVEGFFADHLPDQYENALSTLCN